MANNYNNEINTIGSNVNMPVDPVAAALRTRAESEMTAAAQKAQEALDAIEQGAERNEQVQINLFDFHDGGALVSKGSGDKVRMRKIYQLLYEKAGAAAWKITDIAPAKATTGGHTNRSSAFGGRWPR